MPKSKNINFKSNDRDHHHTCSPCYHRSRGHLSQKVFLGCTKLTQPEESLGGRSEVDQSQKGRRRCQACPEQTR